MLTICCEIKMIKNFPHTLSLIILYLRNRLQLFNTIRRKIIKSDDCIFDKTLQKLIEFCSTIPYNVSYLLLKNFEK